MVGLDPVVGVLLGSVPRRWQQLLQYDRVGRCEVGDNLDRRDFGGGDAVLEELVSSVGVSPCRDEHVDDLAGLVDRTVHVAPPPGDFHVGLVHHPAIPDQVSARAGSVGQQRREPLHPPVDADMVSLDAPLGEQLFDIAVGQAKA